MSTHQFKFSKAVFIVGPTASGKSAFAHTLVDRQSELGCVFELVNIDAFQFYRDVDVGTAKPTAAERRMYRYHGIDILDLNETVDAARYSEFVWKTCRDMTARGVVPVCVGGSGLYLRAALHGLDPLPPRSEPLRAMFRASAAAWGWPELHRWLEALAPERAAELHPNDKTRIERALEIALQLPDDVDMRTLFNKTDRLSHQKVLGDAYLIHVDCADAKLKARIKARTRAMFDQGWLAEVRRLFGIYGDTLLQTQSFRAIGYPDILAWLRVQTTCAKDETLVGRPELQDFEQLVERIETQTWRYVKRQRTWNAKEHCDWAVDTTDWDPANVSYSDDFVEFLSK